MGPLALIKGGVLSHLTGGHGAAAVSGSAATADAASAADGTGGEFTSVAGASSSTGADRRRGELDLGLCRCRDVGALATKTAAGLAVAAVSSPPGVAVSHQPEPPSCNKLQAQRDQGDLPADARTRRHSRRRASTSPSAFRESVVNQTALASGRFTPRAPLTRPAPSAAKTAAATGSGRASSPSAGAQPAAGGAHTSSAATSIAERSRHVSHVGGPPPQLGVAATASAAATGTAAAAHPEYGSSASTSGRHGTDDLLRHRLEWCRGAEPDACSAR